MKKRDLLAMKSLQATRAMLQAARENPIITKKRKSTWGYTISESKCKFMMYFRATAENGILKVAVFIQQELQNGVRTPRYEVYCDRENKTYTTYDLREDKWRSAKIDYLEYPGKWRIKESENWQQDSDRKLVNDYFETGQNRDIYAAVLDFQAEIKSDQLRRKHRSELEEIDEVMREVPDIPKNFKDWIAKNCFAETLFYEPESMCHHRWPRMYCTHCKQWMDVPTDYKERPEHNKETKCPKCGTAAKYKSWNKQKCVADETDVGLLQRLKDDSGWIMRSFWCKIKRRHDKGWEQYELCVDEKERARLDETFREVEFFEYGEYKYTGVTRWCHECRRSQYGYYYSREIGRVTMYTPNLRRELKREPFGRMDLKKIMRGGERERVEPVFILMKLKRYPYIEYLQKCGLDVLANEIMRDREEKELFQRDANRINDVLRLDGQRFQRIRQLDGGCTVLRLLQHEQNTGKRISDENIRFLEQNKVDARSLIGMTEKTGMNVQRTVNYLRKQMEITGQDWNGIYRHYVDYIDLAEEFGMDITDEIVCRQPKMMEYHDRYTERKNREKNNARDAEVDRKYKEIRKNRKRFEERFAFQTDEFRIVVPKKASDITREGRLQHHCVGASDNYIANMNNEKFFILFLRKNEDPESPYYTLEATWDGEIKQFYAAYDRQPDKEKIEAVLKEFTKSVKKREDELKAKLHEAEIRDGLKAVRIGTHWGMYKAEAM